MAEPYIGAHYKHYKGPEYIVLSFGKMSNTEAEGQPAVIYYGVEKLKTRIRTLDGPDGWRTPTEDGRERFVLLQMSLHWPAEKAAIGIHVD